MRIRLGTRGSELARTQSGHVADDLRALGHDVELVVVSTEGDVNPAPLSQLGGVGVFAAALRKAMLAGQVDIAVHSYKDLPTAAVPGLVIAAVPQRVDPHDVLISAAGGGLADLPSGARVGTGSPRRAAQLLARRPDLAIVDIRGNVDTRIGLVRSGQLDAVVLAAAGLARLGHIVDPSWVLDFWPAPAQGALGVECRADDEETIVAVSALDHRPSRFTATAERAVLAALGAGCAAPIATRTCWEGEDCVLAAMVLSRDGAATVRAEARWIGAVPEYSDERCAETLGSRVASDLMDSGAGAIVELTDTAPSKLHDFHS